MAEAGSFCGSGEQQADIVRVIGEYVRLKKSGQNFTGLCLFMEKTPSFAVHPVKQIFICFGCGKGGDVFSFVDGDGEVPVPGSGEGGRGKVRHSRSTAKERTPKSARRISSARR